MKKITLILGVVLGVVLGFAIPALAARNSGGTFTWTAPGGEVAAAGQTISSAWANSSLAEVRQALTDSLSRSGQGGMLAALKICDASTGATPACNLASSPGLRFESSTNTGLYLDSGPTLSVAVGGSNPLDITATSVTANVALRSSTSLVLEDPGAGSFTATVAAPTLGASYSMALPTALPGSTRAMTMTSGGQIGYADYISPAHTTPLSGVTPSAISVSGTGCSAVGLNSIAWGGVIYISGGASCSGGGSPCICSFSMSAGARPYAEIGATSDLLNNIKITAGGSGSLYIQDGATANFNLAYPAMN